MSDTFTVIKPLVVTPAMIEATNVSDEALPPWAAGPYTLGDVCISGTSIWECKQTGNSQSAPTTGDPLWFRLRSVNSMAALDRRKFTPTRRAHHISYTFVPGESIGSFAALNLHEATQIRVRLIDPEYDTVYDTTQVPGQLPIAADWHAFWLLPWEDGDGSQGLFLDLPSYPFAKLHIDIEGSAELSVQAMLFGMPRSWGTGIRWGLELGGRDYSMKESDKYGETTLNEGFFADLVDCQPVIHRHETSQLQRFLKSLRATPALYVIVRDQEAANVYAKFTDFRIVLENTKYSELSIQLESLI